MMDFTVAFSWLDNPLSSGQIGELGKGTGEGPRQNTKEPFHAQKNRSTKHINFTIGTVPNTKEPFHARENRSKHKRTVPNTKEPFKTHNNYNKTPRNCCSKHKITITKHAGTVPQNNNYHQSGGGSFPMRDGRTGKAAHVLTGNG
jgi:hypothetical protein